MEGGGKNALLQGAIPTPLVNMYTDLGVTSASEHTNGFQEPENPTIPHTHPKKNETD